MVGALFGGWRNAGAPMPKTSDPAEIGPAAVSLVVRPNSVQTSLWVGTQLISRTAPDYDVVTVMNAVIGGGPTYHVSLNSAVLKQSCLPTPMPPIAGLYRRCMSFTRRPRFT